MCHLNPEVCHRLVIPEREERRRGEGGEREEKKTQKKLEKEGGGGRRERERGKYLFLFVIELLAMKFWSP